MTSPNIAEIVEGLTAAQRDIMLGHMVEIPPEDGEGLQSLDLKGEGYWHEEGDGRRLIWPITPLGLKVRAHLSTLNPSPVQEEENG